MHSTYLLIFLGMLVVTFIPRVLPLTLLSKVNLPTFIIEVLNYIPISILGALLVPSLLVANGSIDISLNNLYLMAGIITTIAALFTRKLFVLVIVGIFSLYLLVNFL